MVVRVDKEKGYIDLSKRRVSPEDLAAAEERFNKSKMVRDQTTWTCSGTSPCACMQRTDQTHVCQAEGLQQAHSRLIAHY